MVRVLACCVEHCRNIQLKTVLESVKNVNMDIESSKAVALVLIAISIPYAIRTKKSKISPC